MDRYVIDTHSLVWYFTKSVSLSKKAKNCFKQCENNEATIIIPTIVLAESLYISEKKKISFNYESFITGIFASTNYSIHPFDFEVFLELPKLTQIPEIHDRIIVVTALLSSSTLITKDRAIISSNQLQYSGSPVLHCLEKDATI